MYGLVVGVSHPAVHHFPAHSPQPILIPAQFWPSAPDGSLTSIWDHQGVHDSRVPSHCRQTPDWRFRKILKLIYTYIVCCKYIIYVIRTFWCDVISAMPVPPSRMTLWLHINMAYPNRDLWCTILCAFSSRQKFSARLSIWNNQVKELHKRKDIVNLG